MNVSPFCFVLFFVFRLLMKKETISIKNSINILSYRVYNPLFMKTDVLIN